MTKEVRFYSNDNDFKIGFVSGLIDSEGYVNNDKSYIMVVNTNKGVLEMCKEFLKLKNIDASIKQRKKAPKDRLFSYRMYISVKFKILPHLSIKAGYALRHSGVEIL